MVNLVCMYVQGLVDFEKFLDNFLKFVSCLVFWQLLCKVFELMCDMVKFFVLVDDGEL